MPLIYHGTPITPNRALKGLEGRAFCLRHGAHQQAPEIEAIGAYIMYDNGAFSKFTKGKSTDWPAYYAWLEPRLFHPGRWAIIPDEIDAPSQIQDGLINEWPYGFKGAPVWHLDEPISRLIRLAEKWPRICMGSTGEFWEMPKPTRKGWQGGVPWRLRMDESWRDLENMGGAIARHPYAARDGCGDDVSVR